MGNWGNHMRVSTAVLTIAWIVQVTACHSPAGPGPIAVIRVDSGAAVLLAEGRVTVNLGATVENRGTRSLFFANCGGVLERQNAGAWEIVWSQICTTNALASPGIEIPPAVSLRVFVPVVATLGSGTAENWSRDALPGTYRLRLLVIDESGTVLDTLERTSVPFNMTAMTAR